MISLRNILTSALILLLISVNRAQARPIANVPYDELLEKSDLVVIAAPTATADTKERARLPGYTGAEMIEVETKFTVATVLKGAKPVKEFALRHYRSGGGIMINGPLFASFEAGKGTYLLFLKREPDGHYAPTTGQLDPAFQCVHSLSGAFPVMRPQAPSSPESR